MALTGSERLNFIAFHEALLEARGLSLGEAGGRGGEAGRKLTYHTKIQFNGNLLVGKACTALLGLMPGDEFEIRLGQQPAGADLHRVQDAHDKAR